MNKLDTIKEFKELGCEDNSKCALAYHVIRNLLDDGVNITEKKYLKELGFIYIVGTDADGKTNLYLPVPVWDDISLLDIEVMQTKICKKSNINFKLAVCDSTSTVLYYSMTSGWPSDSTKQ